MRKGKVRGMDVRGMGKIGTVRPARRRSAELDSAVSRICNPPGAENSSDRAACGSPAEYNSAIRQITNLRYGAGGTPRQALLHSQSSGVAQRPAFTGFRIT